ncbi:MAG TPA: hypothetical protein VGR96_03695, partial [Acidobacteriaceae bacterium]|nr:hypothetical protein [Acidobacteriaceae bacterium]
ARRRLGAAAILLMAAGWAAMRLAIQHRFAHNPSELGPRLGLNLHTLLLPHHWPQLFSAGGYLVLFVWLERRRLPRRQQLFLWAALLCAPPHALFRNLGRDQNLAGVDPSSRRPRRRRVVRSPASFCHCRRPSAAACPG